MRKKKKEVKKHNANKSKKEYNISKHRFFYSLNENTQIKQNLTHFFLYTIMHKPKLVKIQNTIAP